MDLTALTANADLTPIYAVVGVVVVAQIGTILTIIIWLLKATWKASEINSDVARLKSDMNAAHEKLRLQCNKQQGELK